MEELNSTGLSSSMSMNRYHNGSMISPEIVEISEESRSFISSRDGGVNDVYVAVGKDDLNVLKWALDHAVLPGASVFLIHVFSPITSIPTPVGRLSKSQVSQEQVKTYMREENTRRRNLLQKYIRLCNDAKVPVDTMLIESDVPAKAILELISVLNIKTLVMGTKRSSSSRRLRKGLEKSKFVQKNAPDFCEVTIVSDGKKVVEKQVGLEPPSPASNGRRPAMTRNGERNFFECVCFSGKFN
ncbi:UspA [Macleaya cordata]|uniref:UspA n=1 Tax=Macleaya cordata TaxID=56857 RepID=A0A200RDL4_MACCD|nr:UspA [Macleaya cordata]